MHVVLCRALGGARGVRAAARVPQVLAAARTGAAPASARACGHASPVFAFFLFAQLYMYHLPLFFLFLSPLHVSLP